VVEAAVSSWAGYRPRNERPNGHTEAVNLMIKKVKRVEHGVRNLANDHLRPLLHGGVTSSTHQTARL
jgi:hypothetical protein